MINDFKNDPQFLREQARAAAIGKYAAYRYTYIAISERADYRLMLKNGSLWKHLRLFQNTVSRYMRHYIRHVIASEEYRKLEAENPETAKRFFDKKIDSEEERIGRLWICVKNPYKSQGYSVWSKLANSSVSPVGVKRKTETEIKNPDDIDMVYSFNKYGEYSMANIKNGELDYPLENLYKLIYQDIKTMEEEYLSYSERAEIMHKRRELEDLIYKYMKLRESIEQSYKDLK